MQKQKDNTLAWVSYITIIGWIVALVIYSDSQKGNSIVRFHLRQSFGIYLLLISGSMLVVFPIIGWLIWFVVSVAGFVFWLIGLIAAVQYEEKPIPVVGRLFQEWFSFIK